MLSRWSCSVAALLIVVSAGGPTLGSDEIPGDLVVDVRIFEARSTAPDFKTMQELAFFINTDGRDVTEPQWLATIARQAADSFLTTLAYETLTLDTPVAAIELEKRSRKLRLSVDLSEFSADGVFNADIRGELLRRNEPQRSFDQTIELRAGQTHVWSGPDLELSASEYLSQFRDYSDGDHRRELYDQLREYTTFLVVAVSLRRGEGASETPRDPVTLSVPDDVEIPTFESPIGIDLVGTVELELEIDSSGATTDVRIRRSSIPELNSRILGEAESWRFPDASGQRGRLTLELKASP